MEKEISNLKSTWKIKCENNLLGYEEPSFVPDPICTRMDVGSTMVLK